MSWWSSSRAARRESAREQTAVAPALLDTAFRDSPTGVAVLGEDTTMLSANARLGALLGYAPDELVGVRFTDLLEPGSHLHPDDGTDLATLLAAGAAAGADSRPSRRAVPPPVLGSVPRREVRLHTASSEPVWVLLRWAPTEPDADGRPRLVLDVSDLPGDTETEDRLHELDAYMEHLADASEFGIALTNLEGRLLYVNPALCELLGYSEDEFLTMTYNTIIHPDDWEKTSSQFDQIATQGLAHHRTIKRYVHKDGRVLYCRRVARVAHGRDGTPRSLLVFIEPHGVA